MDAVLRFVENVPSSVRVAGGVVIAGVTCFIAVKKLRHTPTRQTYPDGVVILHQVGRSSYAPSQVPFNVKLETYLRMAKVPYQVGRNSYTASQVPFNVLLETYLRMAKGPYQNVHDRQRSSKGKFPWIELNGQEMADSSFCVKLVNKTFDVDLNKTLSPTERANAHAWQKMIEESTYWTFALHRWVFDKEEKLMKYLKMPRLMLYFVRSNLIKAAHGHGMGRHSVQEVYQLMEEDLRALSDFIGNKKYLMGDTPCEEDAAVFGQLSQFYWLSYGSRAEQIFKKYQNLCNYCERMKAKFWPDWDDCITNGGLKMATK